MSEPLPRRVPGLWLPPLASLLLDDAKWAFRSPQGEGAARLRVWRAVPGGHFAVVTESGRGLPVIEALGTIWSVLSGQYGPAFGLALYWQAALDPHGRAHADLVLPQGSGDPVRIPLHPPGPSQYASLFTAWWDVFGAQVAG